MIKSRRVNDHENIGRENLFNKKEDKNDSNKKDSRQKSMSLADSVFFLTSSLALSLGAMSDLEIFIISSCARLAVSEKSGGRWSFWREKIDSSSICLNPLPAEVFFFRKA